MGVISLPRCVPLTDEASYDERGQTHPYVKHRKGICIGYFSAPLLLKDKG